MSTKDPEKLKARRAKNNLQYRHLRDAWRRRNRARVNAQARKRYDAARASTKARKWRQKNAAHCAHKTRLRTAAKRNAIPRWARMNLIKAFYAEARRLGLHVDHIVPLKSPLVCGLHCEANLQMLRATDNYRKGNRQWPDMWT